jgi:hypothetical protein
MEIFSKNIPSLLAIGNVQNSLNFHQKNLISLLGRNFASETSQSGLWKHVNFHRVEGFSSFGESSIFFKPVPRTRNVFSRPVRKFCNQDVYYILDEENIAFIV